MPQPHSRTDAGTAQFRRRIPRDLVGAPTRGLPVVLEFPATSTSRAHRVAVRHGRDVLKFSLGTACPTTTTMRMALATAHVESLWSSLRTQAAPLALTHRQIIALSGEVYRRFVELHSDEPGSASMWAAVKGMNRTVREGRNRASTLSFDSPGNSMAEAAQLAAGHASLTAAINARPTGVATPAALEGRFGSLADYVLALHGLARVDPESRSRLLLAVEAAATDAARALKRNAVGDYTPDPAAQRFPPVEMAATKAPVRGPRASRASRGLRASLGTWEQVITSWSKSHELADKQPTTRRQYASFIHRFAKHAGVGPARVTRDHVRAWINDRIADGIGLRTIRNNDLIAIRVVFAAAKDAELLPSEFPLPTDGVSLPRTSATSVHAGGRRGFTDEEAEIILAAALKAPDPLMRWAPWLLATSGARASEVVCLRHQDIREIDGVWCFHVTPEAGRHVKSRHSIREVPIHPTVIEQGFLEFVASRSEHSGEPSRLFFDPPKRPRGIGLVKPGKTTVEKLRRWLRSLPGIAVGSARGVDPNHAWRHRVKTIALDVGIDSRVIDAVCGHAPASVGAGYGVVSVRAKATAVAKLPTPRVGAVGKG